MYKNLILNYIDKLKIENLYEFRDKKKLKANNQDIEIIYKYIKNYKNVFFENPEKYILMNKDYEVLSFLVTRGEKDSVSVLEKLEHFDKAPYGMNEDSTQEELNRVLFRLLYSKTIAVNRSDYEKKLAEDEMCTRLVYETTDEKKIKKIKKILGRVDYSRRLDELYSTITSEKQLSLTKK